MNSTLNNSTRGELLELFNSIIGTKTYTKLTKAKNLSYKRAPYCPCSSIITSTRNTPNTSDTSLEVSKKSRRLVYRSSSFSGYS